MKLMGENGPADPQVGYVDGYLFEERLLEGVRFRVEPNNEATELVCYGVHPDDAHYMTKFNNKQIREWCDRAAAHAMADECQDENNTEDLYWE